MGAESGFGPRKKLLLIPPSKGGPAENLYMKFVMMRKKSICALYFIG